MSRQYAFRLPDGLVERLDAYARMRARVDGRKCTRTDALRLLIEKGLALGPAKMNKGPAFETPVSLSGLVTDRFEFPPVAKKKQQPPYRRQDRVPGVAFNQATEHIEGRTKKKR